MAETVGFDAVLLTLCFSPYRPSMAGSSGTWPLSKPLSKVILMALVALVLLHSASSESPQDFAHPGQQKREVPLDLLSQTGRSVRRTLDAWVGPETVHLVSEVREAVPAGLRALTEVKEGTLFVATASRLFVFCVPGSPVQRAPNSTQGSICTPIVQILP